MQSIIRLRDTLMIFIVFYIHHVELLISTSPEIEKFLCGTKSSYNEKILVYTLSFVKLILLPSFSFSARYGVQSVMTTIYVNYIYIGKHFDLKKYC